MSMTAKFDTSSAENVGGDALLVPKFDILSELQLGFLLVMSMYVFSIFSDAITQAGSNVISLR